MDTGPAYTSVNLKLTDNATVNVNGSVQDSDYTGSGASLVIDAGSTLNVSGNATFRNIITLSGNLNVDGVLDFEKRTGNLAETTKITLNKGAKITSLNDEILIANGSGYKTNVVINLLGDYANVTDSALNGMTTNIIAGASANATNDVILVTFGFSSSADGITDYSTGDISLGNLNLGANQVVTLDFTGLEADTTKIVFDSLYVEDKTRGDVDYEYNNSSKLVFQDFEDGILEINTDSNMIFKGTTYDDLKLELGKDDYLTIILKDAEGNALTGAFTDGLLEELNNSIISTVPEPSTYAAIFGALALGLAVYRRRK